ncbi:hypothetical protein HYX19_02780 [Candidatus Woesearchaeota archaeon]|nr:hypothetical protein [Candidatus Woesearchaeota archaeon]
MVSKDELINKLIENEVLMQNKTAELVIAINNLIKRMDTMVTLFEDAAKHIKSETEEPLMKRLEVLLEQNKNLAHGLAMLEAYVREKSMPGFSQMKRGI